MNIFRTSLLLSMLMFGAANLFAEYTSMEFRTVGGETRTIGLDALKITFADGKLIATNSTESATFDLSSLSSMEFSDSNSSVVADFANTDLSVEVYSIQGIRLGKFDSAEAAATHVGGGCYIFKFANGKTFKKIIAK